MLRGLAQHANAVCIDLPPRRIGGYAAALERVCGMLHATGTFLTTTLGSGWAVRSLDEVLRVWRTGSAPEQTSGS
jgi:anaphase-promoting complex subunit 1